MCLVEEEDLEELRRSSARPAARSAARSVEGSVEGSALMHGERRALRRADAFWLVWIHSWCSQVVENFREKQIGRTVGTRKVNASVEGVVLDDEVTCDRHPLQAIRRRQGIWKSSECGNQ